MTDPKPHTADDLLYLARRDVPGAPWRAWGPPVVATPCVSADPPGRSANPLRANRVHGKWIVFRWENPDYRYSDAHDSLADALRDFAELLPSDARDVVLGWLRGDSPPAPPADRPLVYPAFDRAVRVAVLAGEAFGLSARLPRAAAQMGYVPVALAPLPLSDPAYLAGAVHLAASCPFVWAVADAPGVDAVLRELRALGTPRTLVAWEAGAWSAWEVTTRWTRAPGQGAPGSPTRATSPVDRPDAGGV